jgi:hypothetical protein
LFGFPSFVFCQPLFQIRRRFEFRLLGLTTRWICATTWSGVSCGCSTLGFRLVESCDDALMMCLSNLCRNAFHAKYFDFESLPVGQ